MSVKRKLVVYQVTAVDLQGNPLSDQLAPWTRVESLPYGAPLGQTSRRIHDPSNPSLDLAMTVHSVQRATGIVVGDFASCRKADLPFAKDDTGIRSAIPLAQNQGLDQSSHFVLMDISACPLTPGTAGIASSTCLMLCEYNHFAPRPTSWTSYFQLLNLGYTVWVQPIILSNHVQQLLAASSDYTKIYAKVGQAASTSSGIGTLFGSVPRNTTRIGVSLSASRSQKFSRTDVANYLNQAQLNQGLESFSVTASGGMVIDLLAARASVSVDVATSSVNHSRQIDERDLRTKLRQSLDAHKTTWGREISRIVR